MERNFEFHGGVASIVAMVVGLLVLSGCTPRVSNSHAQREASTAPTPYQPVEFGLGDLSMSGFGYRQASSVGHSSNVITVKTNIHSSLRRTTDMAFLRAAEVGREGGYTKFRLSYQLAGTVCRASDGSGAHNLVKLYVQYGSADVEIAREDDRSMRMARERDEKAYIGARPVPVGMTYKIDQVLTRLTPTVRNAPETLEDGKRNLAALLAACGESR